MNEEMLRNLGPLGSLCGTWEGTKGEDRAPSPERGVENNKFREVMSFECIGQVDNHEQSLFGLRYRTMAWEEGNPEPFHEEVGYWLWDPERQEVLRCFIVPRGVSVIAGGHATSDSKSFELEAKLGSPTLGICSAPFLDREFKTVSYKLKVEIHDPNSFTYEEDSVLQIKGQAELFHHIDKNKMRRIGPLV